MENLYQKRAEKVERLVAAVKAREILWDTDYRGHRNRYKLERYWNEVALELGTTTVNCRKRWKNLKDQCRKEIKKGNTDWPHFQKLRFIHHLFVEKDSEEEADSKDIADEYDETKRQRLSFTSRKRLTIKKRRQLRMDTEKLINLVKERELVWNRQNKRHHHWHKLDNCWREISQELGVTRDEARIKWKYLRDIARKEYRKPDSEWQYLSQMQFLINQFGEYSEGQDDDFNQEYTPEDEYVFVAPEVKEDEFDEFDTKPVITETDFNDDNEHTDVELPVSNETVDSTKDEDVGFFNSLLPHVRKLNPAKKMMLRIKMQELVYNNVYNDL